MSSDFFVAMTCPDIILVSNMHSEVFPPISSFQVKGVADPLPYFEDSVPKQGQLQSQNIPN